MRSGEKEQTEDATMSATKEISIGALKMQSSGQKIILPAKTAKESFLSGRNSAATRSFKISSS